MEVIYHCKELLLWENSYIINSFDLQGLIEIVFGPDLFHGEEAASLVKELILILQRLEACNCQMEAGALRIDANISIRPFGTDVLGKGGLISESFSLWLQSPKKCAKSLS